MLEPFLKDINFWRLVNPEQFLQPALAAHSNHWLCLFSVGLAILSASTLFPVNERYLASKGRLQFRWLCAGSIAMGLGIWAMHFTSMLAFHIHGTEIEYSTPITIFSVIPSILASGFCILLSKRSKQSVKYLHINALIMAMGIGLMHYIGMEAIITDVTMYYDPYYFFVSIIAAYLLSFFALYTHIKLSTNKTISHKFKIAISSIILGLAVSSMHFIAMEATYFQGITNNATHTHDLHIGMVVSISFITIGLISLIIFGSYIDHKMSKMAHSIVETEELFKRFSEITQTAIFTFNDNHITYCNSILNEITGFNSHEIYTKPIETILGKDFDVYSKKLFDPHNPITAPFNTQYELTTENSTKRWLYLTLNSSIVDNELTGIASAIDITNQKEIEINMRNLAYSDHLTNLPNRRSFIEHLENHIKSHRDSESTNASYVFLVDLDNFKSVNDTNGHQYGDNLIKEFSKRLNKIKPENSFAARQGGDEFIVLIEAAKEVRNLAEDFINELSKPYSVENKTIQLNCSMGVCKIDSDILEYDQILNNVDIALYKAKKENQSSWILFDENLHASAKRYRQLQPKLKSAIKNSELELHYQPIVDAKTNQLIGFESLARWHKDKKEWISPGEFIPIAEKTGLIDNLSIWALETACHQIDEFNRLDINNNFYISVNISPSSFYDEQFYTKIIELFNTYNINKGQLKIEITERMLINYSEELILKLNSLRGLGCELMIDDFGTGYSSLSYLHVLPISTIKIDRSFVLNLAKNSNAETIVKTIITLSKSLDLKIISEGIETIEQAIKLQKLGSDYLQGYYFSKPIPVTEVIEYINKEQTESVDDIDLEENGQFA